MVPRMSGGGTVRKVSHEDIENGQNDVDKEEKEREVRATLR